MNGLTPVELCPVLDHFPVTRNDFEDAVHGPVDAAVGTVWIISSIEIDVGSIINIFLFCYWIDIEQPPLQ